MESVDFSLYLAKSSSPFLREECIAIWDLQYCSLYSGCNDWCSPKDISRVSDQFIKFLLCESFAGCFVMSN
jgi:hypothetical protein